MAKVSELKCEINGVQHKIPVNCGVDGVFKSRLPNEVARVLKLTTQIQAAKLSDLQLEFARAIKRFKEAETIQELLIAIRYGSSGKYMNRSDGYPMFGGYGHIYSIGTNFDSMDSIGFEFSVVILETVDGVSTYYKATKGDIEKSRFFNREEEDPNKYYKRDEFRQREKYKFIPFTEDSLNTLEVARENLRKLSEVLFNFIEQDPNQIQKTLSTGTLLMLNK